jgi:hypothetical protein
MHSHCTRGQRALADAPTPSPSSAREAASSFAEHARCGVPITLLSLRLALVWLYGIGHIGV